MTELPSDVVSGMRDILNLKSPSAIIDGVRSVISREIKKLNPDADISFTDYFNHTYVPDLILEWSTAQGREERPVYLRSSLRPTQVAEDVRGLANREPVVLALAGPVWDDAYEAARRQTGSAARVMVTDLNAMATLAQDASPPATDITDMDAPPSAPLLSLAKSNILRGGKGVITNAEVARITEAADLNPGEELTSSRLEEFQNVATEFFAEDASLRLQRASDVLRFGLTSGQDIVPRFEGRLSESELRILIPYLLGRDEVTRSSTFWGYIGSMMTLEDLEDLWETLAGVDLSPIVLANLGNWRAKRAQLGLNSDYEEGVDAGPAYWQLRSRMLSADAGPLRIHLASDSRRLRGRQGSGLPSWAELEEPARAFSLAAIELRGLSRRVTVSAEASPNVYDDVATVQASMDDVFTVASLTVVADDELAVDVDFAARTVTSRAKDQTIGTLADITFALLGADAPVDTSGLFQS